MAEVTEKPSGLPSGNALDSLDDPDAADLAPREIRLGANTLVVLEEPPGLQETRDIVLRLRTWRRAEDQRKPDGDITYFCQTEIVTAWELGKPKPPDAPPEPDDPDRPPLLRREDVDPGVADSEWSAGDPGAVTNSDWENIGGPDPEVGGDE